MQQHGDWDNLSNSYYKFQRAQDILDEWSQNIWEKPPSSTLFLPFPGGVLLGFTSFDGSQKHAFKLPSDEANNVGSRLRHYAFVSKGMDDGL